MELLGPNQSKGSRHAQVIIGIKLGALLGALLVLITKKSIIKQQAHSFVPFSSVQSLSRVRLFATP